MSASVVPVNANGFKAKDSSYSWLMSSVTITRVINTCLLIEVAGHFVLTDPYFADHSFFRTNEPIGLRPDELPQLSAILGGHRAFDHWQPRSMRGYEDRSSTAVYTASRGMSRAARRAGFDRVETLRWGDRRTIGPGLQLTCVPGQRTLGMASNVYILDADDLSMLIGTEALDQHSIERCAEEHRIDIAVLPIDGATVLGRQLVMTAADAIRAATTLSAPALVPIHHSELPVPGLLRCPSSIDDLREAARHEPGVQVHTAPTGDPFTIETDRSH
jgi:L-ascorbate metabolism protein UlaG (beta-lactamase superfamily)